MNTDNVRTYTFAALAVLYFVLTGCASEPQPKAERSETEPRAASEQPTKSEKPITTEERETTEAPAAEEEAPSGEQSAEPDGVAAETEAEEEEFEVSEEVYDQTFDEVEQTIEELNRIIRNRNFQAWKDKLTERYIDTFSSPERLSEISETPVLERNEIELSSLEDYFRWVVVPSRSNARLDDLNFEGEDRVEAIMEVRGQSVTLYELRRVNGSWKVDVF